MWSSCKISFPSYKKSKAFSISKLSKFHGISSSTNDSSHSLSSCSAASFSRKKGQVAAKTTRCAGKRRPSQQIYTSHNSSFARISWKIRKALWLWVSHWKIISFATTACEGGELICLKDISLFSVSECSKRLFDTAICLFLTSQLRWTCNILDSST